MDHTADIMWLTGFRARLEGKAKPLAAGDKQQGWIAADGIMTLLKANMNPGGGYGEPA